MALCIFCFVELEDTTKPEHVLPNALGGRLTTRSAICSSCNNVFGGTFDNELASQVTTLRNMFHLRSGTGNPAPALKNIQASVHKVNIRGDGEFELVGKPFEITQLGEGRWNVQIRVGDEEQLRRIVPHIAAKLGISEESFRAQRAATPGLMMHERPGVIGHPLAFGGPDAIRSMVKSSLVLWSTLVGNDDVRSAAYEAARRFVVEGGELFVLINTRLDLRYFDEAERMKAEFGPLFNLIYIRSNRYGKVVAHFTLYNAVAWHITLAEAGGATEKKIALISNPLNPAQWTDAAAEKFDVPFEWLNSPDYSDEMARSRSRLEAILSHFFDANQKEARLKIIEDCFKTLGLIPDQPVPPERLRDLIKLVSYRLTHHAFGMPHVVQIPPSVWRPSSDRKAGFAVVIPTTPEVKSRRRQEACARR